MFQIFQKYRHELVRWAQKKKTTSGREETDADKMMSSMGSHHEDSPWKNSPPMHITASDSNDAERNKTGDNAPITFMDDTEPDESAVRDLDMEDNSITNVSRKIPYETKGIRENQSSTSKLPSAPLNRYERSET